MWDLWWTEWHCFRFLVSVGLKRVSTVSFVAALHKQLIRRVVCFETHIDLSPVQFCVFRFVQKLGQSSRTIRPYLPYGNAVSYIGDSWHRVDLSSAFA